MSTSPYLAPIRSNDANDPHANTKRVFAVTGLSLLSALTGVLVVVAALR